MEKILQATFLDLDEECQIYEKYAQKCIEEIVKYDERFDIQQEGWREELTKLEEKKKKVIVEEKNLMKEKSNLETMKLDCERNDEHLRILLESKSRAVDECITLEKIIKPSDRDLQTLRKCKLKLDSYKELTGVRWDYDSFEKGLIRGYVVNKSTNHTAYFSFNKDEYKENMDKLSDDIWEKIGSTLNINEINDKREKELVL